MIAEESDNTQYKSNILKHILLNSIFFFWLISII